MSDTLLADVVDALYEQLIAVPDIADLIAAKQLRAFDGPLIGDASTGTILSVGSQPSFDGEDTSTTVEWDWATLGISGQFADVDEWIRVPCGIHSIGGNSAGMRDVRRTAIGVYAAAATFIRGTTLGIPRVMWCIPQPGSLTLFQTPRGAEVVLGFTANVRTRI